MFSYKAFIKYCLTGSTSKRSSTKEQNPRLSITNLEAKEVRVNSLNFSSVKPTNDNFVHSPRVPQLPSMATPIRLVVTHRPKSIDRSPPAVSKQNKFSKRNSKLSQIIISPPECDFKGASPQNNLKVSTLNTNYCCNEAEIMKSLEKAKQYFPIPLGRKHLRTTSLSISHTPMTRLYSPQNFVKREGKIGKDVKDLKDVKDFKDESLEHKRNLNEKLTVEKNETGLMHKSALSPLLSPHVNGLYGSLSPNFDFRSSFNSSFNAESEIEVEGKKAGGKYRVRSSRQVKRSDLYDLLIEFGNRLELFRRKFEEIDKHCKGYLVAEDLRSLFGKSIAEKALAVFLKVSSRKQVFLNEFLAVCAVYCHNGGEIKGFNIADEGLLNKLDEEIEELRVIFEVHTKGTVIPKVYLQGVTQFLQPGQDVLKAESLVLGHVIDFCGFLRWIPYFLYIHVQLLNRAFQ